MPSVTVLMPVYNSARHLPEAVASILSQTFQDFTLLIIDDGSTDGSEQYLKTLSDPKIKTVCLPHRGLGAALNAGLEMCDTEFLARMDADDVCSPDRLQLQVDYLRSHPGVGMLGTQFRYFGAAGECPLIHDMPLTHDIITNDLLKGQLSIVHASLVLRTKILKSLGGYRLNGTGEDWDMFLLMSETTTIANLDSVLYYWRLHGDNVSVRGMALGREGIDWACECARLRALQQPEIPFADYIQYNAARPWWQKVRSKANILAICFYRRGLTDIINHRKIIGYIEMFMAGLFKPIRTIQRIRKVFTTDLKKTA